MPNRDHYHAHQIIGVLSAAVLAGISGCAPAVTLTKPAAIASLAKSAKGDVSLPDTGAYQTSKSLPLATLAPKAKQTSPATPKPTPTDPPNPAPANNPTPSSKTYKTNKDKPTKYAWTTYVANKGGQAEVDLRKGGLTRHLVVSDFLGKPYYPIHNGAGGYPILDLIVGDMVLIKDVGVFEVVELRDIPKRGTKATALNDLAGDAILQTCWNCGGTPCVTTMSRIVGIKKQQDKQ